MAVRPFVIVNNPGKFVSPPVLLADFLTDFFVGIKKSGSP